eukprot:scaffold10899_cov70-Phaeocystis_antarctica.AAC.3
MVLLPGVLRQAALARQGPDAQPKVGAHLQCKRGLAAGIGGAWHEDVRPIVPLEHDVRAHLLLRCECRRADGHDRLVAHWPAGCAERLPARAALLVRRREHDEADWVRPTLASQLRLR